MYPMANSDEPERRRYRWCPSCRELWDAARFGSNCPVCDGHTLAYVGRSPHGPLPEQYPRSQFSTRTRVSRAAGLINRLSVGLDDALRDLRP